MGEVNEHGGNVHPPWRYVMPLEVSGSNYQLNTSTTQKNIFNLYIYNNNKQEEDEKVKKKYKTIQNK